MKAGTQKRWIKEEPFYNLARRIVALGCLIAAISFAAGCASTPAQGSGASLEYNPETGYPLVGASIGATIGP